MTRLRFHVPLLAATLVGGLLGTAAAEDLSDSRFVHRALKMANFSVNGNWNKYRRAHGGGGGPRGGPRPGGPRGGQDRTPSTLPDHEGDWLDPSKVIIRHRPSAPQSAMLTWRGTTQEGIEYYVVMSVTVDGPVPKDGNDVLGTVSTEYVDTNWAAAPAPPPEHNPADSRFVSRAMKDAEFRLASSYKADRDDMKGPAHSGAWLDPAKAIIERYPGNREYADITWIGTTSEGIKYYTMVHCYLRDLPPVGPDGKDDFGASVTTVVSDLWFGAPRSRKRGGASE